MKTTTNQIAMDVYEAAHEAAILVDRSDVGVLVFRGETRLDLIDRMSTQKVKHLRPGEGAATILTTDIGRMIDRIILYVDTDKVYAFSGEHNSDNVARYLMRFVFFNDDFHIQDISSEMAILGVYGPEAREMLAAAGLPEEDLPLHHWRPVEMAGVTASLHRTDPLNGDGYLVMCQAADKEALWQHLVGSGLVVAGEDAFEFLRIEAGRPRFGHEIGNDYIPLEANLWDDVSFNKGCYIGQEIIARMESRGRIAKKLVKLRPTEPVEVGAEITADGRKAGTVTSAAIGPHGPVALGYVKTAALDADEPTLSAEGVVLKVAG
ncbi:MAG TPA: glycine cleavage T C-terminal barrel domain-containing protein [Anaerolineae bacterium]